ncbi:EAL domain-containing protein [Billgrantia tianxiuensis]|jgi:diguanylate cyclase (GGDEF)-like protein/PAS domain S-box-containing protein|uniref:EAL domain-containing protein n=1 Tax=Billgrantia tianxiuensis TaxID=2497861 RepID=A0A6I6SPJ7_9GAMM|nr:MULTISPECIES: EAL domain-containing protein [Halomonas]MCE8034527.1 EAL domain-containing protein [Halomonas sp. MCCC 1A11057]QHC50404.1 EAL domain-containing protein [Halomonas tianxiuensis]
MSQELPIERIMQTGLLTCEPDTPLWMAAERMAARQCSSVIVVKAGQPLGIWTERDALAVNFSDPDAGRLPISQAMSQPVASLHRTTTISEAALRFGAERRRHFLVVDDGGTPVGILSQTDVALNQGLEPYLRLREVQAAMRQRALVLEGTQLLAQAARSMRLSECDAVVVKCADGELGILTERDLVRFVARHPGNMPIEGLASRPLLTVHQNDTLIAARDLLMNHRVRHLAVLDEVDEVIGLLGFRDMLAGAEHLYMQDLRNALEQRDRALAQSRENLQLAERIIDASLDGIIITDPSNRIEFVNRAFTHMTGYTAEEVIGKTPEILSSGRHDAAFYRQMWDSLKRSGYWRGEIWNRRKSGELFLELLTITAISDESGAVTHYAALFSDITHLRENEERIRKLAYYDALTGLPNRRLLEDRLELAIRHAHRNQTRLAVIFVDLDHFKEVNDALGHAFGDELLVMMAERLQLRLREDDTLARLGGDEFLVLLPDLEEVDEITRIARRLVEAVREPCVIEGQEFRLGCSLGISLYPDDASTAESLVHNADVAMYRAKQEGRNGYRLYRNEMNLQEDRQRALETALRDAFISGEGLQLHYQPVFEREGERLYGAEALLRWHHPLLGSVPPADVVTLAERAGLLPQLDEFILEQICGQLAAWGAVGAGPVPISINLSARQFWQHDLPVRVATKLKEHKLQPGLLGFEISERTLLDKPHQAAVVLKRLRRLGGLVAINDFGTGYASLGYLQELPVSMLKIDRRFVQRLDSGQRGSAAIVAAVAGMAREMELRLAAVGVETEAQREILARHGVELIQGYLTGQPVPADVFASRYLDSRSDVTPQDA